MNSEDEEKDDSFYTFFDRPIYDKVQEVRRNRDLETDFYYLTSEFGIPQLYEETKDEYCAALIVYFHDEGDERGESIKEFALSHLINQGLVLEKTEVFFNEKDKDNDDEINRYLWSHLGVEFLEDLWD